MNCIKSMMLGGAILFSLSMCLTSCEGALDDVLGEWSRPTPGNNTPSGGGGSVTSLSITETLLRLDKSAPTPQALTLNVDPADATVTWESSDDNLATVDASGNVTPVAAGKVTIKATAGGKTATSTVYVYDKIVDISALLSESVAANESWLINGDATTPLDIGITILASATVTLNGINITSHIYCYGDATIILADGSTNKVSTTGPNAGIIVAKTGSLTINAETTGDGQLEATGGSSGGAGIGTPYAYATMTCGNIVINGGTINATGGTNAAGIGTGGAKDHNNTCGAITINGGTVNATGGADAAGIGTGLSQYNSATTRQICGTITIAAGVKKVKATKGTESSASGYNSIGVGGATGGGTQTCGVITFDTAPVYDGTLDKGGTNTWTPSPMVADTYGGLNLVISGNDWTLTPAP